MTDDAIKALVAQAIFDERKRLCRMIDVHVALMRRRDHTASTVEVLEELADILEST